MRNIKFTCLLIVLGYSAKAQFSIQPQIGIENSRTAININEQSFVPAGIQFSPKLALRIDYKLNKIHGLYAGISTSAPAVNFSFSDPQLASTSFNTSRRNVKLRFEGGYQLSTKAINLSKPSSSISNTASYNSFQEYSGKEKQSCREKMSFSKSSAMEGCSKSSAMESCSKSSAMESCSKSSVMKSCHKNSGKSVAKNKGSYMKILPSVGFAYSPNQSSEIEMTRGVYNYKAGAWNTAIVAGTGLEFGRNKQSKFIVNINYLHGLGNMDTKTINSMSNNKPLATMISSKASSWSVSLGVPLSLSKKKPEMHRQFERSKYDGKCGQKEKSQSPGRCGQYRKFMQ